MTYNVSSPLKTQPDSASLDIGYLCPVAGSILIVNAVRLFWKKSKKS